VARRRGYLRSDLHFLNFYPSRIDMLSWLLSCNAVTAEQLNKRGFSTTLHFGTDSIIAALLLKINSLQRFQHLSEQARGHRLVAFLALAPSRLGCLQSTFFPLRGET
jgi:hypothetical protein